MQALLRAGLTAAAICLAISSAHALPVCAPMDVDGDCKSDIVWRNSTTGQNNLWLMNGLTISSQGLLTTMADPAWQIQGVGDFDGDGRADILWRNLSTGENSIWLMNGLTIAAQGSINVLPDQALQVKGIGDFDGDGRADILWRNASTGENSIWLMYGLTIAAQGSVNFFPDQAWQVKGIGDFDGDGRADILWRNSVTGANYAYFMNGLAIASEGTLDALADPYWMPRSATTLADSTAPDSNAHSIPTELTATAVSATRINLSWSAATDNVGVVRYGVYRDGVRIARVSGTTYASGQLSPATTYSYTVAAYDAARNPSAQSGAVSATTKADTQAPSTPANLAATVVSASQIDLTWSAATDNVAVTGYRVYRDGARVASPVGASVSITGLSAGVQYSLTVAAFDAAGNVSAPSAPLSVTTPPALTDTTAPTTPTGPAASAVTPTSLTLSWNAATDNVAVTGYRVYANGTLLVSSSSTSVPITDLLAGGTRSFTVAAFDAAGNVSAPSAPLSVTTPAPVDTTAPTTPTGLVASAVTPTSLTLSWNAAADNVAVTGYRVYVNGAL